MATIFTKIINKEIPAYVVAEDENNIAFLDINPLVKGHTLVVPKKEIDYLFDIDEKRYISLQLFAKKVSYAIAKEMPCVRVGVAVIGLEVPHAHIHLIPLKTMDDMNFSRPKLQLSPEELKETMKKIKSSFELNL